MIRSLRGRGVCLGFNQPSCQPIYHAIHRSIKQAINEQITSNQIKSNQTKSNQIKSNQDQNQDQIKSNQNQIKPNQNQIKLSAKQLLIISVESIDKKKVEHNF